MKAIIPAAGIGTRLRPHTYTLPKALLHVAGKPILSHILDDVTPLEPSSIVLIVGYKGDLIESYVREHYPKLKVDFVFQAERNGIGHAIDLTRDHADTGEPALIILGDTIIKTDLAKVVAEETNVLGVKEVEDPRRFGVCEVENGRIVRLVEKPADPPSNLAIVGLYYLRDAGVMFKALREQIEAGKKTHGEYQVTDTLQMMIEKGCEFAPFTIEEWFDCGKPEAMIETNRKLLEDVPPPPPIDGSVIIPPVSIAEDAKIIGSVIGPYVSVAAGATVRNSVIRDSILAPGAEVAFSVLEESLVGEKAVIRGRAHKLDVGDSSQVII